MNEIYIYGTIGDDYWDSGSVSARKFMRQLQGFGGQDVDLYINSPGGDVFDGSAIYSAIERYPGKVTAHVDGLAASAASFCILAADEVVMSPSAYLMIHRAWTYTAGSASELRHEADVLEKLDATIRDIYARKSGADPERITALMDEETWFTCDEALDFGLVDSAGEERGVKAKVDRRLFARYRHVPEACNARTTIDGEGEGGAPERPKGSAFVAIGSRVYKIGE